MYPVPYFFTKYVHDTLELYFLLLFKVVILVYFRFGTSVKEKTRKEVLRIEGKAKRRTADTKTTLRAASFEVESLINSHTACVSVCVCVCVYVCLPFDVSIYERSILIHHEASACLRN